jgi:sterol desaturase/sphingolipid hydroxylase (fatty acid hydroxylase superfamily)
LLYIILGATPAAGAWVGALTVFTGFLSHSNIRTPVWLGWFFQRPEQHSIHHQIDLHTYNYADLIIWDRLFGTFREATEFSPVCGFPNENERRVREILLFKDVYR